MVKLMLIKSKHFICELKLQLCILLTVVSLHYSFAQTPVEKTAPDSLNTQSLKEVLIISHGRSETFKSPNPVQVLKGTELQKINSLSVADALRYFSGVQIKDYGGVGGLKTINIRSIGTNHTAVFYNGIQLGNSQNGQVDLGKFSLDNIEEIALYSGQKPILLLPAKGYASASAVYLKTNSPVFSANSTANYRIGFKTGSFGLLNPSVLLEQKINNKISLQLSGEYLNANGRYKYRYADLGYDTTVVRQNSDIDAKRIEATLFGKTNKNNIWQLKLYNYHSERGIPGAIVSNRFNFSQRQADDNFFVQTSYEKKGRYSLLLNAKFAYDFLHYTDPDIPRYGQALENKFTQYEQYFSVANTYKLYPFLEFALAADYSRQTLDANLYNFAYPLRQTGLIAAATSLDLKRINIQANLLATVVDEETNQFASASDRKEYTPSLMLSWQPFAFQNFRARAFYKSVFRMPTFNDLYYTFVGNSNLKPEYAEQYNLGFSYWNSFKNMALQYLEIKTDAYYNQVIDKIVAIPGTNLYRWTMINLDEVSIKGIETSLNTIWDISPKIMLKANLNYTYEKALEVTPGAENYKQQIPYIPVHSGSARFAVDYKSISLNYGFIYTGERYSQKANIRSNYMQPWYTHDMAAHYQFNYYNINFKAGLEANNILNQYYDVVRNYPMPGRNYRINIAANF